MFKLDDEGAEETGSDAGAENTDASETTSEESEE